MKNYFENVLKGFKDESSQVVLSDYMRTAPDFLVIDVDKDDMPEILFGFRMGRERYVGVLKREDFAWRLYNVSDYRTGMKNGIFALVQLQEELCIAPRDMGKAMQLKDLFGDKDNTFIGMVDGKVYYGKLENIEEPMATSISPKMAKPTSIPEGNAEVIDFLQGDVIGTGCIDNVSLIGEKSFGQSAGLVKNMRIKIESQNCEEKLEFSLPEGNGYSPILFLGDFTGDEVDEILITYYSAPNGGYVYNYIYQIKDGEPKLLFDTRVYNEAYNGLVQYLDKYKVLVETEKLAKQYLLDISMKDQVYLDALYTPEGKLKKPQEGEILGVIAANPADFDSNRIYNLSAVQQIVGVEKEDTLALLETFFKWQSGSERFEPFMQYVSLIGKDV
ncbi:MAG: hypothetical protein ACRCWY_00195 [Cellulosilyticaceae bacterium]